MNKHKTLVGKSLVKNQQRIHNTKVVIKCDGFFIYFKTVHKMLMD
jgi:hypothetical protein